MNHQPVWLGSVMVRASDLWSTDCECPTPWRALSG